MKRHKVLELVLDDKRLIRKDDKGKSLAYFCLRKPVAVNRGVIRELKRVSERLKQNVRLCLHENAQSSFHSMIICERKGKYYRPHKHLTKGESFHILEGTLGVVCFYPDGRILDACVLTAKDNPVYRVGEAMYHCVLPLSKIVIYHESKPGPFLGDKDSIFPSWAPCAGANREKIFVKGLKRAMKKQG
jgi:cupin fold WbuC family metalloprotein